MRQQPIIIMGRGPNILLRAIYFLCVGWWLGGLMSILAWILMLTVVGLPIGIWLINRLPSMMTLRPQETSWHFDEGILREGKAQRSFWARALYFVLIGWWFSAVWMVLAYMAVVTLIGIPLAFLMYGRVGAITTLYRS